MDATLQAWLEEAVADAARRGLPELEPLLRSLARSTAALRAAAWNDTVAARLAEDPHASAEAGGAPPEGGQGR